VLWLTPSSLFRQLQRPKRGHAAARAQSPRDYSTGPESRAIRAPSPPVQRRYPEAVSIDYTLGLVAIVAAWMSARRWSRGYVARYGRPVPSDWMLTRVDDGPLERERRILIAILIAAVVVVLSVLARVYPS
jgi:hypothetical protein